MHHFCGGVGLPVEAEHAHDREVVARVLVVVERPVKLAMRLAVLRPPLVQLGLLPPINVLEQLAGPVQVIQHPWHICAVGARFLVVLDGSVGHALGLEPPGADVVGGAQVDAVVCLGEGDCAVPVPLRLPELVEQVVASRGLIHPLRILQLPQLHRQHSRTRFGIGSPFDCLSQGACPPGMPHVSQADLGHVDAAGLYAHASHVLPDGGGLDLFHRSVRLIHLSHGQMVRKRDERVAGCGIDLPLRHSRKLPQPHPLHKPRVAPLAGLLLPRGIFGVGGARGDEVQVGHDNAQQALHLGLPAGMVVVAPPAGIVGGGRGVGLGGDGVANFETLLRGGEEGRRLQLRCPRRCSRRRPGLHRQQPGLRPIPRGTCRQPVRRPEIVRLHLIRLDHIDVNRRGPGPGGGGLGLRLDCGCDAAAVGGDGDGGDAGHGGLAPPRRYARHQPAGARVLPRLLPGNVP
mmetsp:Transcript_1363/g.4346  ORF Transcript_1363/g.4346 Transcript_1363/m.4346 type:complete len:460 (+) Transcript_1363:1662-3041(+)